MEKQKATIDNTIVKEKKNVRGMSLPNIKNYYEATVTQTVRKSR